MPVITAKELREKLNKEKAVNVVGNTFRIRKVPLLLLADDVNGLWDQARQSRSELTEKIQSLVSHPTLPMLKRVLLAGVVQPKLMEVDTEESVSIDIVLAHHELSVGLFIEIINFSLET